MTTEAMENYDVAEAEPQDEQSDLKWVVEWLVNKKGQRRAAKDLGVNRKTVALALRREQLTRRMSHAVQRYLYGPSGSERHQEMPLDRMESQIRSLVESVDELDDLVEALTLRVVALEEEWAQAQEENDDEVDAQGVDVPGNEEREYESEEEPEPEESGRRLGRWWRR